MPFARSLANVVSARMGQPFPNPYQQGLLGAFFGNVPGGGATGNFLDFLVPPGGGGGSPVGLGGGAFVGGGSGERDVVGQGLTSQAAQGGRPLFGPAGTDAVLAGRPMNTSLMAFMERLFPGYAQRAQPRAAPVYAPTPFGQLLAGGDPWAQGVTGARAESAARGSRIDALMDEMNAQREALGLPPL